MSTWRPENWMEALFITAQVYCESRFINNLPAIGSVSAFVWDTKENGVLVDYFGDKYVSRYFVTFNELKNKWDGKYLLMDEGMLCCVLPVSEYRNPRSYNVYTFRERVREKWITVYC